MDSLGLYNMTLQASSWDGSGYGERVALVQAMMVSIGNGCEVLARGVDTDFELRMNRSSIGCRGWSHPKGCILMLFDPDALEYFRSVALSLSRLVILHECNLKKPPLPHYLFKH